MTYTEVMQAIGRTARSAGAVLLAYVVVMFVGAQVASYEVTVTAAVITMLLVGGFFQLRLWRAITRPVKQIVESR
jgi:hypothetical protein